VTATTVTTSAERDRLAEAVADLQKQNVELAADRDAGYAGWGEFCLAWVSVLCEERDQAQRDLAASVAAGAERARLITGYEESVLRMTIGARADAEMIEAIEADLDTVSREFDAGMQAGAAMAGELTAVARVLDEAGARGPSLADRVLALVGARRQLSRSVVDATLESSRYRRDFEAASGRAAELAARATELEGSLARLAKQRDDAELIARNALAAGSQLRRELDAAEAEVGTLRSRVAELEAERNGTPRAADNETADDRANGIGAS